MFDFREICSNENLSIINALKLLDETSKKIIVVIDSEDHLKGVVTDGDIRRWILSNGNLESPISNMMVRNPFCVHVGNEAEAYKIMRNEFVSGIPVIDTNNKIVNVLFWNNIRDGKLSQYNKIDIPVVIMAGGKGTRLLPYTKILPKPLIPIGDIPIVQRIINRFVEFGATEFIMTVNHKKNMIKSYFGDIEKKYSLTYFEEEIPLGTGGSLAFLKSSLKDTFILSNCDILIDADYGEIYDFHKKNGHMITMVTSLKQFVIPYGVITLDENGTVKETLEKPSSNHLVNTGVYIIEPEIIDLIPIGEFYHITQLIQQCINKGLSIGTYPISENSWLDMGQVKEMQNMIDFLEKRDEINNV